MGLILCVACAKQFPNFCAPFVNFPLTHHIATSIMQTRVNGEVASSAGSVGCVRSREHGLEWESDMSGEDNST